jgi:hypothetical protein
MDKKLILGGVLVIAVVALFLLLSLNEPRTGTNNGDNDPTVLLRSGEAGWCVSWESCSSTLILTESGELTYNDKTVQVDPSVVDAVKDKIRETGIMQMDCTAEDVMDYSKTTTISLDGETKKIEFPGCDDAVREIEGMIPEELIPTLEIHEWGVMVGCPGDSTYFATSRPEMSMLVKQPVVYVHANNVDELDASFTFNVGKPTDTYPEAEVDGNTVSWMDVAINPGEIKGLVGARGTHVPLESIMETLNDVDADELEYGGERSNFLFYEGEIPFVNEVEVVYDVEAGTATFTNNADYYVSNVMLAHQVGDFIDYEVYTTPVIDLSPGEEMTVDFEVRRTDVVLINLMEGFTRKEAEAFDEIWNRNFFNPDNMGFTNLIYKLPRIKYDELITAEFNPEPDKLVRTMYLLVDLT